MRLKKKTKRRLMIFLITLSLICLGLGGYFTYNNFKNSITTSTPEIVDKIDDYGYYLEEDAPLIYKDLYKELTKVLNEEEINEEEYAKNVALMLVIDFYNLDNKISKNDVGGIQFILPYYRENFVLEASETVYKYIEHNLDGKRTQILPKVKEATAKVSPTTYKYKSINDENAYKVVVNLEYEKDLGYKKEVEVILVHNDSKLGVVYMN